MKPAATPKSAAKAEPGAATPAPAASVVVVGAYDEGGVSFTMAEGLAGVRQVGLTLTSSSSAHSPMTAASLPFTVYAPPTFTDLTPSSHLPLTPNEATLTGRGLFPTLHARVRLTVRDDPPEAKAPPAKGKAAKAEEEVKVDEPPVVKAVVSTVVEARVRMDEEGSPKAKGKGKTKEEGAGVLQWTMPMAGVGWSGTGEGEERRAMEEMVGRVIEVAVAMDGQHFVPTGQMLRYEREVKGKKPAAGADKKKGTK